MLTNYLHCLRGRHRNAWPGLPVQVVEAVPAAAAGVGEVQHLVDFFTSRLTDW